jgi:hypothetical protein
MTFHERTVRQTSADADVVRRTDETTTTDPALTNDPVVTRTSETRVDAPVVTGRTVRVYSVTTVTPSGGEMTRRVVVLIFGIIQILIAARIVLLLLAANADNGLVSFIYQLSDLFVAPFSGIFNSDALKAGRSVFDIAAVAAFVGWTLLEAIIFWVVNLFRREPTI